MMFLLSYQILNKILNAIFVQKALGKAKKAIKLR